MRVRLVIAASLTMLIAGVDPHPVGGQNLVPVATKRADNEIVLTRTFAARRNAVFAAMTEPEQLLKWQKTANMEFVACDVDFRAGGTFRYVFQRPSGKRLEVRGAYTAVDPPRAWTYIETYDFSPLRIDVATVLEEAGATTVFKQVFRYASQAERDEDYDGVATSSAAAYDNLDRHLAARSGRVD